MALPQVSQVVEEVIWLPTPFAQVSQLAYEVISQNLPFIAGVGIASAEAFGTSTLGANTIAATGVTSEQAFGDTAFLLNTRINGQGINSEQAFGLTGFPAAQVLNAQGVLSEQALDGGTFRFVSGELPPSLQSPRTGGRIRNLGATTGVIEGGDQLILVGDALDMTGCVDTFETDILDAMWLAITSGSGVVSTSPADRSIQLSTGSTPGSAAGLRTVATVTDVDVEVGLVPVSSTASNGTFEVVWSLELFVSNATSFKLSLLTTNQGTVIQTEVRQDGQVMARAFTPRTKAAGFVGIGADAAALRLVRIERRVVGLVDGVVVVDLPWVSTPARVDFRAENDLALASTLVVKATRYDRRPAVALGSAPVLAFTTRTNTSVTVLSPRVPTPRVSDIIATGCGSSREVIVGGFTYVLGNKLTAGRTSAQILTVLGDAVLKRKV